MKTRSRLFAGMVVLAWNDAFADTPQPCAVQAVAGPNVPTYPNLLTAAGDRLVFYACLANLGKERMATTAPRRPVSSRRP